MPWQPLPVIGAGPGVAAVTADQQAQQARQGDFLANLLMHAQNLQAQREQTKAFRDATQADRNERTRLAGQGRLEQIVNQIPSDTEVPSDTVKSFGSAGIGRFAPIQTLGSSQTAGVSTLGTGAPTVGSGAPSGESQAQVTTQSPPQATGAFKKLPSDAEKDRQALSAATQAQRDFTNKIGLQRLTDAEGNQSNASTLGWARLAQAATTAAQNAGSKGWELQKATGPDGKDTWVRINKDTGEIKPTNQSDFAPTANATTANRLSSAQAVLKTGNDIKRLVSDPTVAAQLGPVMSRYNNLADFVGNPPPQFAKLAGMIESYSLANMGVHGMRSAGGADAIKKTIGLGRHTPESLLSVIDGLNGFAENLMQGEGRGAQIPGAQKPVIKREPIP